ncbi:acetyltransferase [Micromonospora sp. NPDC004551]|uniref:acetyltransferase n=1 Tax=Micromonospora sp. NPDC004551 TaxID=3154284 RepID=UPI0033BC59CD
MSTDVVIVGCSGHGREVFSIVQAVNEAGGDREPVRVLGFVDDAPSERNLKLVQRLDVAYLGRIDWLRAAPTGTHVLLGLGHPAVRRRLGRRIDGYGLPAFSVVHPDATVGRDLVHGEGLVVFPGARVTTNVTLGRHVHLNQNATVGHDSVLDDYVSVNPSAAVSGDCHLGEAVLVGTCAAVLQGRRVGPGATVGASACVVRDVPPGTVVKGVPAR